MEAWNGFKGTKWQETIDVRDFIINNHISYEGDGAFLEGATERTKKLSHKLDGLFELEITGLVVKK